MNTSVAVLLENRTEVFLYDRQLFGFLGQVVEFEECFALAVRIEHVTALIFAIEVGRTHSIQQVCRFLRCEQSGREHGYLSLQHLIEMRYLDIAGGELNQVIRFVQAVFPLIGKDGLIYLTQCSAKELLYLPISRNCLALPFG